MEFLHRDINNRNNSGIQHIITAIILPIPFILLAIFIWIYNPLETKGRLFYLFCPFNKLTGLYCPGCGSTRAVYEMLHLHVLRAIKDNALLILVFGPLAVYSLIKEYLKYLYKREILPSIHFKKPVIIILTAGILIYTITRNIPLWPFYYLIP